MPSSAAAAMWRRPVGIAAARLGLPLVDHRGRPPPGPRQPPARAPRAPGLPGVRDPGARGRALPRDGQAGPARRVEADRESAREQLRARRRMIAVLLVFGGSQGALSINTAVLDGLLEPDPGFHVLHVTGTGTTRWSRAGSPTRAPRSRFTVLEYVQGPRRRPGRLATSCSRAPARRCSSSRPRGARRSWCRIPYATGPPPACERRVDGERGRCGRRRGLGARRRAGSRAGRRADRETTSA